MSYVYAPVVFGDIIKPQSQQSATRIPLLNCSESEALRLHIINPIEIYQAQLKAGAITMLPRMRFYKIPVSILNPERAIAHFYPERGEDYAEYQWLRTVTLHTIKLPEPAIAYYRDCKRHQKKPKVFQYLPTVLYRGEIYVADLEIINLS